MIWDLTFYNNISCGRFSTSCQDFANLCCFSLIDTEISLSMDSTDFQWKLTQVICTMFCDYTHLQVSNALSAQEAPRSNYLLESFLMSVLFFHVQLSVQNCRQPFQTAFCKVKNSRENITSRTLHFCFSWMKLFRNGRAAVYSRTGSWVLLRTVIANRRSWPTLKYQSKDDGDYYFYLAHVHLCVYFLR